MPDTKEGIISDSQFSWISVRTALNRIASGSISWHDEEQWPEVALEVDDWLIGQLKWALGQNWDEDPRARKARMRREGRIALDTSPTRQSDTSSVRDLRVLEICAGAGGQAHGLQIAGFTHEAVVELDKYAAESLRKNRPYWTVIEEDIRKADLDKYKGVDLLAGGVPCQPFSTAGEGRGREDQRDLIGTTLDLVARLKPKAVMLENVTGIMQVQHSNYRLEILARLDALGYDTEWRILDAADFRLPQSRRRSVLVAFKRGIIHRFRWPEALPGPRISVGESLKELMASGGWPYADTWAKRAQRLAPTLIGGSQKKKGIDLAQPTSRKTWMEMGVDPNGRARSAPGSDADEDHMPKLTLPMMQKLQGIPYNWHFEGPPIQQFHQIANAFPPQMAAAMGLAIKRALTGIETPLDEVLPKHDSKGFDLKGFRRWLLQAEREGLEAGYH